MNYWLIKSEIGTYSILDLEKSGQTIWDGVRNYQARNFLRQMQIGDTAFFYHSNTKIPGIVGLVRIVASQVSDPTQFDPDSKYYDSKSDFKSPRWQTVSIEYIKTFPHLIPLEKLKQEFSAEELWVTRRGNRLSVMPVSEIVASRILAMTQNQH